MELIERRGSSVAARWGIVEERARWELRNARFAALARSAAGAHGVRWPRERVHQVRLEVQWPRVESVARRGSIELQNCQGTSVWSMTSPGPGAVNGGCLRTAWSAAPCPIGLAAQTP